MPTVTVRGSVSVDQATKYLAENLGVRYKCATRGASAFSVERSPMTFATVKIEPRGDATVFRVHGGGVIITRIINELGVAKEVARALGRWEPTSST